MKKLWYFWIVIAIICHEFLLDYRIILSRCVFYGIAIYYYFKFCMFGVFFKPRNFTDFGYETQIGRASCRGRVEFAGGEGAVEGEVECRRVPRMQSGGT